MAVVVVVEGSDGYGGGEVLMTGDNSSGGDDGR